MNMIEYNPLCSSWSPVKMVYQMLSGGQASGQVLGTQRDDHDLVLPMRSFQGQGKAQARR